MDEVNGFRCECMSGVLGDRCEAIVRQCPTNPCGDNAVCVERPAGKSRFTVIFVVFDMGTALVLYANF